MIGLVRQAAGAVVIVVATWVVRAFLTATPSRPLPACVCGCPADAHEHYRRGVDCGACGPAVCAEYEAAAVVYAESECPCGCGLPEIEVTPEIEAARLARRDAALGRPPLV